MKTILIDDEIPSLESLEYDIEKYCPELHIVGKASNADDAIRMIDDLKPDLVLSDIQMPRMNAFTMLDSLTWRNFELIFVTAFNHYAVKAFEFSAVDYLVKPVDHQKLKQSIKKVLGKKVSQSMEEKLAIIMHNMKYDHINSSTLAIPTSDGAEFIDVKDIMHLQADVNYCILYFANEHKIVVSKPLKHFDNILSNQQFIRIHQSHLVNVSFIKSYRKGAAGSIILKNGTVLPISRTQKSVVNEFLTNNFLH